MIRPEIMTRLIVVFQELYFKLANRVAEALICTSGPSETDFYKDHIIFYAGRT